MMRPPTYLRTVVTTACPLSCDYCHMEGDPHQAGTARKLESDVLDACLQVAAAVGIRKFKFLGGEPLVRRDLPARIERLRALAPSADLSIITSGVAAVSTVEDLFRAGLDRMNVSIHGFALPAFAARSRLPQRHHEQRAQVLAFLLSLRRPLKLNYVYSGPADDEDLKALLAWAATLPVIVNVLDDLGNVALGPSALLQTLQRLRGPWIEQYAELDTDSLPTTRLRFRDGLTVEIKTEHLGTVAPWRDCSNCSARARCREGIYAVRLTHRGFLQLCMDRPDLSFSLVEALKSGQDAAAHAWREFVAERLRDVDAALPVGPLAQPARRFLPVLPKGAS